MAQAIEYARALGCKQVNCLAGIVPHGRRRRRRARRSSSNLRFAAPRLKTAGIKLLIEPINTRDIPGLLPASTSRRSTSSRRSARTTCSCSTTSTTCRSWKAISRKTIETQLPRIPHMQLADNPGRNEPGTGEINYGFLFAVIDSLGYDGWIGCEYKPAGRPSAGLGWIKPYLRLSRNRLKGDNIWQIGFIGLGIMGTPMAGQPDQGRSHAILYSIARACRRRWSQAGGNACASGKEVAQKADIIIVMVPDTPHVEAALFGDERRRRGPRAARSWST